MHLLGRLISITISYSLFVALIERAYIVFVRLCIFEVQQKPKHVNAGARPTEDIQALHTLDYRTVEPIRYRPFEKKQHVTMGMLPLMSQ